MNAREQAAARDELARRRLDLAERRKRAVQVRWELYRQRLAEGRVRLTGRQREIASLWAEGYTLREVAEVLGLASHTNVVVAVRAAQRKLGLPAGGSLRDRRRMRAALAGVFASSSRMAA